MNLSDPLARAAHRERLLKLFNELTSIVSLERLLHRIVEAAAELTDAESAGLLLRDGSAGVLRFVAASLHADILLDIPVPIERSIAGAAFISGQSLIVNDVPADPRHFKEIEDQVDLKARSLVAVPLQYLQHRIGVLEVENKRGDTPFDEDDMATLQMLAAQATVAIENVRLIEALEQHRSQLGQMVDERVAEIKTINAELQNELTERRQAEDELRKLVSAVEHSASTILITDTTPRIEYVNPAFTRMTGYTLDEVRGKNPRFLKSGRQSLEFYQELWATLLRGEVWRGEFINRKKNGELYFEATRITPVHDSTGRVSHYVAVKDDITDRKRSEEALAQLNERLKILREIDQAILGAQSPSAIARAGLGRLSQVVPAKRVTVVECDPYGVCEVLAIEATRELGLDVTCWLKHLYRLLDEKPHIQGVANLHKQPHRTPLQDELHASGVRSYVLVPLREQNRVIGALILESDYPDMFTADHVNIAAEVAGLLSVALHQAQLRASLALRTEELEAQNAELDAFAHTVAHDLKNPLGVVSAYSEFLADYIEQLDPPEIRQAATMTGQSAQKAVSIVNNLLLLASTNKQEVELKPLDMSVIVEEAQHRLKSMVLEYQPQISLPVNWPLALGHAPWIEEVWVNYLSNAMKYGGRPPLLELSGELLPNVAGADITSRLVRFWVRDNGRGLTLQEQARLFTPFERLSQAKIGGHGLGLSIVKRIVEKLGGTVGVESEVGQGSTFFFTLPASVK
ncbi:MAG TPA: GAF domain-containing protein [Anaerolineae bacterium]|nr:GAF domain-containing protein [Anaerolineae bacterium]